MNKTELFIKIDKYENESLMFDDTYLAGSIYGTKLGLEFQTDVSSIFSIGDLITIDKTDKTINPWADGTASIIGITGSSVFPAPGSLVFTDRELQLPISFTSNENGVIYQGTSISSNWNKVDLSDDVAFPITFNIADVREINNRNGAYSKTIVIPGTKENNKVFKYIFDIQGVDNYDTRIRVKANVVVDTIPVLEGYLQLDTINCDNNEYWSYNCVIYGENANFSKNIDQNALLNSLDFSEFNHFKTLDIITQSWAGDYTNGYYYPLLDYNNGKNPVDIFPVNTTAAITAASQLSYINENFKPSIYVKQYWDKIFKLYGYSYESDFLNSEAFTNLIVPTNVKVIQNDDDWRFNSSFKAGITSLATSNIAAPTTNPQASAQVGSGLGLAVNLLLGWIPLLSQTAPFFYDPQNVFTTGSGLSADLRYTNNYLGSVPKSQKIVINLDYKITPIGNSGINGLGFTLFYKVYRGGQYEQKGKIQSFGGAESTYGGAAGNNSVAYLNLNRTWVNNAFGDFDGYSTSSFDRRQTQIVYDTEIEGQFNSGESLFIRVGLAVFGTNITDAASLANYFNTSYKVEFFPSTNGYDGCYMYNKIDTNLLSRQPYRLSNTIPGNIKQIDFINSIIKMFNLYLSQDKVDPKKIYIEPRDQFYSADFVDWSRKLDISKDILQKPIVDRKKRVFMSYKEDKDLTNTLYKSNHNEIYGQYEYKTGNEFDTSEQKIEVIFSPSPLLNRKKSDGNLDNRLIYTQILDAKGTINAENYNIVDTNIRILYKKNISLSGTNFRIFDYQSYYTYDTYPYAGHLDDPTSPGLDLSFAEPIELFYEWQNFGYTNNNIYKLYYEQFFEEVYGLESKHIVAYVYLTPQDIIDFDYRKLVYLDSASSGTGGYFRVNKIEYDPFNKMSYKVELIKVLNNFKSKYNKVLDIKGEIGDVGEALPKWGTGLVTPGNYNSGGNNVIVGVDNSVRSDLNIVGGIGNQVLVGVSNIVTGYRNNTIADNSGIISGGKTTIYGTGRYSNIIGGLSQSLSGPYSNIIGGFNNKIDTYSSNNQILGGCNNRVGYNPTGTSSISQTINSLILGGINNTIEVGPTQSATDNVFILGGLNNTIAGGVTNSFILGGENFTATQSNTIYLVGNVVVNGIDISSGIGGSGSSISVDEIAFGTGTGITSSSFFKFTPGRSTLLGNSGLTDTSAGSLAASTKISSIDGSYNTILSSENSSMTNGSFNSIISACSTVISTGSKNSIILGGYLNSINGTSSRSSIIGGSTNYLGWAENSSIINSFNSQLRCYSIQSSIIGGVGNIMNYYAPNSTILGGCYNIIQCNANGNNISGGCYNQIVNNSISSNIIGGCFNQINTNVYNSGIIGGYNNILDAGVYDSGIVGGITNRICDNSYKSSIIGGKFNVISQSVESVIIGSSGSCISASSERSAIIGGVNLSLAGVCDTVLVPKLAIDNTNVVGNNNTVIDLIPGILSQTMEISHTVPSSFFGDTYSSTISFSNGDAAEGILLYHQRGSIYPDPIYLESTSVNLSASGGFGAIYTDSVLSRVSSISINNYGLSLSGDISGLKAVSGGGPYTITSPYIKTISKVFLTGMNGASDAWYVDNIVDGVSFDITALTTGGTGDVAWLIIN
jgi:hypothetical protein